MLLIALSFCACTSDVGMTADPSEANDEDQADSPGRESEETPPLAPRPDAEETFEEQGREAPMRRDAAAATRPLDAGAKLVDASVTREASSTAPVEAGAPTRSDAGVGEGGAAPAARLCTNKPGAKRGRSVERIRASGAMRSFIMHRPAGLDPNAPAPIVIVPHGYAQDGEEMYRITKYWELGEKEGIVTLYPDGASAAGPWNVGRPSCQSVYGLLPLGSGDDQAFLEEMVNFVESDQCIDRARVYLAGFSMGAYFSNASGCNSDLARALAPHSGGSHDFARCKGKPKPVLLFHGNADRLIPYDCGKETRKRYVERNGCSAEVEVRMVKNGVCEYHKGCMDNGQVAFCTLNGMNHGWAGGPSAQVPVYPDDYPSFVSATELSWEFFETYAR